MKLYAPKYYKDFVCIADRCRHSCCVGWEIDIDSNTMEKYAALNEGYGKNIRRSIDTEGAPHFRLTANERCPHLNDAGLCRIILALGEDHLCDICREHPRFYNDTVHGKEVGLGMACEEACRLILGSDEYANMIELGNIEGEREPIEFDTLLHREKIYAILSDASLPYPERLRSIHRTYGVSPHLLSDHEWKRTLASLEYLDEKHTVLFSQYTSDIETPSALERPLERALAYFIFRHCTAARAEYEYRAALGLCLLCERLLASMVRAGCDIADAARIISEEIEYSEDNTEAITSAFAFKLC